MNAKAAAPVEEVREFRPQPGPQWAFLASPADVAIYGGAAGGGKSYALLLDAVRWHQRPGYSAVLFRRQLEDQKKAGGLWSESMDLFPQFSGRANLSELSWTWRHHDGRRSVIQFRGLSEEADKLKWQGAQLAFIGFDELTHFTESQFWYLQSRLRTGCGVRPYLRATTNPEPDSWVRRLIAWWIDDQGMPIAERAGVLRWFLRKGDDLVWGDSADELLEEYPDRGRPRSLTFIPARLEDNPALNSRDPEYRDRLFSLPAVEQAKLLGGNWNARSDSLAFDPPKRLAMLSAERVTQGVRILCVDPGGLRNPMGIVVLRVGVDAKRAMHVEVIHSERWYGPLVDIQGTILDRWRRFGCARLSIDNAHTLLVAQLEALLGPDKVSHPRGSDTAMWQWYTTINDLAAGGTLRIGEEWRTLNEDLDRVRVVGTQLVLPEYETQIPVPGQPDVCRIHCDEFDALVRCVPVLGEYTARPTQGPAEARPRADVAPRGDSPGRMATIAGHTRGRTRLR